MTIIEGIAERIAAIHYDGLPPEAVRWAKAAILDTVGVTLAGAAEPCARIAAGVLGLDRAKTAQAWQSPLRWPRASRPISAR